MIPSLSLTKIKLIFSYDPVTKTTTFHKDNFKYWPSRDRAEPIKSDPYYSMLSDMTKSTSIYIGDISYDGYIRQYFLVFDSAVEPLGQRCYSQLRTITVSKIASKNN